MRARGPDRIDEHLPLRDLSMVAHSLPRGLSQLTQPQHPEELYLADHGRAPPASLEKSRSSCDEGEFLRLRADGESQAQPGET